MLQLIKKNYRLLKIYFRIRRMFGFANYITINLKVRYDLTKDIFKAQAIKLTFFNSSPKTYELHYIEV